VPASGHTAYIRFTCDTTMTPTTAQVYLTEVSASNNLRIGIYNGTSLTCQGVVLAGTTIGLLTIPLTGGGTIAVGDDCWFVISGNDQKTAAASSSGFTSDTGLAYYTNTDHSTTPLPATRESPGSGFASRPCCHIW